MRRLLLILAFSLLPLLPAQAQTAGGLASKIGFDIVAPDLASAQAYTYRFYMDGAVTGTTFAVTCTNSATVGTFSCTSNASLPALTIGTHTLQLSAANVAGESAKSTLFTFTIIATPNAPTNPRLVP